MLLQEEARISINIATAALGILEFVVAIISSIICCMQSRHTANHANGVSNDRE